MKWLARLGLLVMLAAACFGLMQPEPKDRIWPLPHHTGFLLDYLMLLIWFVAGIAAIALVAIVVFCLWDMAFPKD